MPSSVSAGSATPARRATVASQPSAARSHRAAWCDGGGWYERDRAGIYFEKDRGRYGFHGISGGSQSTYSSAEPGSSKIFPVGDPAGGMGAHKTPSRQSATGTGAHGAPRAVTETGTGAHEGRSGAVGMGTGAHEAL